MGQLRRILAASTPSGFFLNAHITEIYDDLCMSAEAEFSCVRRYK